MENQEQNQQRDLEGNEQTQRFSDLEQQSGGQPGGRNNEEWNAVPDEQGNEDEDLTPREDKDESYNSEDPAVGEDPDDTEEMTEEDDDEEPNTEGTP